MMGWRRLSEQQEESPSEPSQAKYSSVILAKRKKERFEEYEKLIEIPFPNLKIRSSRYRCSSHEKQKEKPVIVLVETRTHDSQAVVILAIVMRDRLFPSLSAEDYANASPPEKSYSRTTIWIARLLSNALFSLLLWRASTTITSSSPLNQDPENENHSSESFWTTRNAFEAHRNVVTTNEKKLGEWIKMSIKKGNIDICDSKNSPMDSSGRRNFDDGLSPIRIPFGMLIHFFNMLLYFPTGSSYNRVRLCIWIRRENFK